MNRIFFKNDQETEINTQEIDDNLLKILREEYLKHINEERNTINIWIFFHHNTTNILTLDENHFFNGLLPIFY